jgi:osmotically-inducible protein OsmY
VSSVVDRLRTKGQPAAATAEAAREGTGAGSVAPDAWLTAKIQAKYFVDDEVKARDIDVTTQNGVVTLSGVVEDEAERRQAVALARSTDGVRDVTDQLRVDPEAAKSAARPLPLPNIRPIGPIDADPWITTKVQAKYFLDPAIKGLSINVNTDKGVVTLKGTVPDEQAKQEAERIARETDGVSKVVNELVVGQR